jgi:enterochelin esterase-like enzyme
MTITTAWRAAALSLALAFAAGASLAQPAAPPVGVERIKVHGTALEGNLEGDAVDRDVIVYLPPSYGRDRARRYPVLYALHGYSIGAETWTTEIRTPAGIEAAYAAGAREMIVVIPDARTLHNGSMYSSSVTTGDWETFVARDLVAYVDGHYRTIADRASRGLAGHSMGGYGTIRIGMKHPEVFGALYAMSPCCLSPSGLPDQTAQLAALETITPDEAANAGWGVRTVLASAAAWSPNPKNPPFFLDLPTKGGVLQPSVAARWAANAPLATVHQYVPNLRRYAAIAVDVGDKDGLVRDARALHDILDGYGIANSFQVYDGDHVNRVAERFQGYVLPFFSRRLVFDRR